MGITADPAAAAPDFDDSGWAIRDAQGAMDDVPDEDQPAGGSGQDNKDGGSSQTKQRYAWFRLHIKLAPNHGPLSLLIELPVSQNSSMSFGSTGPGVDVFANGKQVNAGGTARRRATALSADLPDLRPEPGALRNFADAGGANPLHSLRL